jgi:replicative DNA helicase
MGGGPGGGELAIILAGSKAGKSTLLARFAVGALWKGKNVAIATGELSKEKYRKRIDSMITQIPASELTKASLSTEAGSKLNKVLKKARRRLKVSHKQMKGGLHIQQWPSGKGTAEDISLWLDDVEAEFGYKIDVLFVDYIRVFRPTQKFDEQRLSVGQVALDLRGIATERDIPVWTATQTNRAGLKKKRLSAEDIAEDISQLFTLDFLVAFCQTEEEAEQKPEQARVYLMYARDVGMGGVVNVELDRDRFTVNESEHQPEDNWKKARKR